MNDAQFLDRVRLLPPAKRVAGCTMLILGIALSSGLAVWGQVQGARLSKLYDDLSAGVHPTTAPVIDAVPTARQIAEFWLGASVGICFQTGLTFVARWAGPKGQPGPWSEPASVRIAA